MSNKLLIITGISISISVLLMKEILYLKRDLKQLTNKIECDIRDMGQEEENVAEEKENKGLEKEEKEKEDKGAEDKGTIHSDYELLEMDDNKEQQDHQEDGKGDKDYYNLLFDIVKGRIGNFVSS